MNDLETEHRITRLEAESAANRVEIALLDEKHMLFQQRVENWIHTHDITAAKEQGFRAGVAWLLGAIVVTANVATLAIARIAGFI